RAGPNDATIEALSLIDGSQKTVVSRGSFGRYLPGGYLTYINQGTLFSVPFDPDRMEAARETPTPVVQDVVYSFTFRFAQVDISRTGTLVYRRDPARGRLIGAWLDRSGRSELLFAKPGDYVFPSMSPDGQRIAVKLIEDGIPNLWIHDRRLSHLTRLAS